MEDPQDVDIRADDFVTYFVLLHEDAAHVRTRLDGVAARGRLVPEVIIADDDLGATAALEALDEGE